jgi:hypothetical protein
VVVVVVSSLRTLHSAVTMVWPVVVVVVHRTPRVVLARAALVKQGRVLPVVHKHQRVQSGKGQVVAVQPRQVAKVRVARRVTAVRVVTAS